MSLININEETFAQKGHQMVVREGKKQILVLKLEDQLFALDNRCPHEGYPLSEGSSDKKACMLTCNWHNWKFDLKSGKCVVGGDNVRTYPVSKQEGQIVIDISDPTPEEIREQITEGFKVAFEKRQYGRLAREIARYDFNGLDPIYALKKAILWSYDKFEYGMTHAYAGAADWLNFYHSANNREDKIIALTEAIDHIAYDSLRHSSYPYSNESQPYNEEAFLEAIENEDQETATQLVNGGLASGMRYKDFERALTYAALRHYNNFGHSLIYVYKASQLSERLNDPEIDRALVLVKTRDLTYASREDLIPEFKNYAGTVEKLNTLKAGNAESISYDELMGKKVRGSYKWLLENFPKASIKAIYDSLLAANAHNFLTYDLKYQEATHNPVTQNVGWLSYTHALTFSNAVRVQCEKFPEFWKAGLAQMASFYGRNTAYTDPSISLEEWKVSDVDEFKKDFISTITDHGMATPIFSCHVVKTGVAVLEEYEKSQAATGELLLASINRFLNSPIKEKHVRRLIHQGINLVAKDFE